eukprot:CAMPEP_0197420248 /NCGR_PEP_ID=MMETSP1170-20131217/5720_1 /TAXON_ID=54406 /ORGANISM="Sarcinochrysis sp, Strain CCMP770" /LENGTH=34 /DNA_ID= /DNA_START= /DNA_END= /DNA_ORIENTATION=
MKSSMVKWTSKASAITFPRASTLSALEASSTGND